MKKQSQPSIVYLLLIWANKSWINTGTEQEPSIYVSSRYGDKGEQKKLCKALSQKMGKGLFWNQDKGEGWHSGQIIEILTTFLLLTENVELEILELN